jgi:hypothetical protein
MKNIKDLITQIHMIDSTSDLQMVQEAVSLKRQYLTKQAVKNFVVGDKIQFTNRGGIPVGGTVVKVNRKYIVCETPVGRYRVPATMLSHREEA